MMSGLALLLWIVLAYAGLQLLRGAWLTVRTRTIRREVVRQRCFTEFASARSTLFALVRRNELSARSNTFRTFHAIQSRAVSEPQDVAELLNVLQATLFPTPRGELPWMREAASWPAGMRRVLQSLADGLGDLVHSHRATLLTGGATAGMRRSASRRVVGDLLMARESLRAWSASGTDDVASVASEYRQLSRL